MYTAPMSDVFIIYRTCTYSHMAVCICEYTGHVHRAIWSYGCICTMYPLYIGHVRTVMWLYVYVYMNTWGMHCVCIHEHMGHVHRAIW